MNQVTRDFIREHAEADVRQLALRGAKDPEVDLTYALEQIAGRQMAKTKIPSWAAVDDIIYPPHLSMEQCSSEQTAKYKASIAGKGVLVVDLTAGFGVDMAFISQGFQRAVHVERQPALCAISSENYKRLGLQHIEVVCGDGVAYLHQMDHADLIYLDPARRDAHGGRTYGIADCTPNVLEILDEMLEKADRVMLKLSPMLDWRKAVSDLGEQHVKEVHIVSVHNECKELLIIMRKELETSLMGAEETTPRLYCVNDDDCFVVPLRPTPFHSVPQHPLRPTLSHLVPIRPTPSHHLFEPNASIMKAGCFEAIEQSFGVHQLSPNSHLFVSEERKEHFPGRAFYIKAITSMNKKDLKDALQGITHANLTVRNFPLSVPELRKKLKLADGGNTYIFATTLADGSRVLLICEKRL